MIKKQTYRILLLLLVICGLTPLGMRAQATQGDERMTADFQITGRYGKKGTAKVYSHTEYALFKTRNAAEKAKTIIQEAIKKDNYPGGPAYDAALEQYHIRMHRAKTNGTFSVRAFPGQAVLVYVNEEAFGIFEVSAGKTDYQCVVEFSINDSHSISEVEAIGRLQTDSADIKPLPPVDDGLYMLVPINFRLSKGDVNHNSRVMAQAVAIDCQTEDTVAYVTPLVFEGKGYHQLQTRRMAFNFMRNEMDSVATGYVPNRILHDGEEFKCDTMVIFRKPIPQNDYKFYYNVTAEDLTHVARHMGKGAGSCNKYKLFKFLSLNGVTADMDLSEFRVDAGETMRAVPRDLKLNFILGKAELTNDSTNFKRLNMLVKEMKEYGDQLMRIEIEACSSPDGGYDANVRLSKERGQKAMNLVMQGLGRADVTRGLTTKVYTWDEVVKELDIQGHNATADSLRTILSNTTGAPDSQVKAMGSFTSTIEPVLESMRSMRCVYRYEQWHIMDQDEVYDFYKANKAALLQGDKKIRISDGDYFNLLASVRDSAELDTITVLAYNHMTSQPAYQTLKFSQYVCNRYAELLLKRGTPNLEILRPFIDLSSRTVTVRPNTTNREALERVQMNRKEILINQLAAYYQMEKRDSAISLINYWFANPKQPQFANDPAILKLRNYVSFKEQFLKYYTGRLEPQYHQAFKEMEEFVLSSAPDNRPALYTEARAYMKKSTPECKALIEQMSDSNPKKWYLRGILEAEAEEHRVIDRPKDYVPLYLALFYQSFCLDPNFRYFYLTEAHVSDELREKYKYRKRDIPRYKALLSGYFIDEKNLKVDDDELSGIGLDDDDVNVNENGNINENENQNENGNVNGNENQNENENVNGNGN